MISDIGQPVKQSLNTLINGMVVKKSGREMYFQSQKGSVQKLRLRLDMEARVQSNKNYFNVLIKVLKQTKTVQEQVRKQFRSRQLN